MIISLLIICSSSAQNNQPVIPPSDYNQFVALNNIPQKNFYRDPQRETAEISKNATMPKMGYCIDADIDIIRDAQVYQTEAGTVYLLRCKVDEAKGLVPYFDNFYLTEGSLLNVYNTDRTEVNGAFTHENNHSRFFTTGLMTDKDIIFEYRPSEKNAHEDRLHINQLGIAYRMVPKKKSGRDFNDAQSCEVNVNCSEGINSFNQKRAVVRIMVKSNNDFGWCSGALINNTNFDCKPYILSADHCTLDGNSNYASASDFQQWVYYFNYESPTCNNPLNEGTLGNSFLTGSSKIAQSQDFGGDSGSDFLLTKLNSNPPASFNVYYAGWNRDSLPADSGVCIHHPEADIKKISQYKNLLQQISWGGNTPNTHWSVNWAASANGHGVTESGSSGSPLFNQNGEIVGTLTGGDSYCSTTFNTDYFGKLFYHWDKNGTVNSTQLKPWLDASNTGLKTISGRDVCGVGIETYTTEIADVKVYPNPSKGMFTISMEQPFTAKIYTIDGKEMRSVSGHKSYAIDNLSKGIYIVEVTSKTDKLARKVIVE